MNIIRELELENGDGIDCPHCKKTITKSIVKVYNEGDNLYIFEIGCPLCEKSDSEEIKLDVLNYLLEEWGAEIIK